MSLRVGRKSGHEDEGDGRGNNLRTDGGRCRIVCLYAAVYKKFVNSHGIDFDRLMKLTVDDRPELVRWGCGQKTWTGLCRKSRALSVFQETE